MASYDSPTGELTLAEPTSRKVEFRFCKECSNMLYPREDRVAGVLYFQCRTCMATEEAPPTCIYRNEMAGNVGETSGVTQDVASDPTVSDHGPFCCVLCGEALFGEEGDERRGLPHVNRACPNNSCDGTDAVFFQSQQRTAETGMRLFYVCCTCGHVWSPIKER